MIVCAAVHGMRATWVRWSIAVGLALVFVSSVLGTRVTGAEPVQFDLETARLRVDDDGAASLAFADGTLWPTAGEPAFALETEAGLAPDMLERAQDKVNRNGWRHVTLEQGDALHLRFPDDSFDYVMAFHVVSVVPDPLGMMAEVSWTHAEAIRTFTFWKLVFVFGLVMLAMSSVAVHRIPSFMDRGLDAHLISYATALDAAREGFRTTVLLDLTAAVAPATLDVALRALDGAGVTMVGEPVITAA